MAAFQTLDWIVVGAYFAILLGIALWSMRQKQDTSTEYFLAGRHVGWFVIGASIFASNIGAEHIVGLAGTAAKSGVVMGHFDAIHMLPHILPHVHEGSVIHIHSLGTVDEAIREIIQGTGFSPTIEVHKVKKYRPHVWHIVQDVTLT